MEAKTFKDLERAGWTERAEAYDDIFALVTDQAIDSILNSFGDLKGKRVLDVACGTGRLTAQASQRGAHIEGIDFASTMIARAKFSFPHIPFREGDAEYLPYDDGIFDSVICAFGLLHMEFPDKALAEAFRVLKSGGRLTFAVWCSPAQGNEFFGLVLGAVQEHGTMDVNLPPAPPIFRFADSDECSMVLENIGFSPPETSILPVYWRGKTPQDVLDTIYKSVVRMPLILNEQTATDRERIHQAILKGAEQFISGQQVAIAFPAFVVTTTKP